MFVSLKPLPKACEEIDDFKKSEIDVLYSECMTVRFY
jgi:hypothetical protein